MNYWRTEFKLTLQSDHSANAKYVLQITDSLVNEIPRLPMSVGFFGKEKSHMNRNRNMISHAKALCNRFFYKFGLGRAGKRIYTLRFFRLNRLHEKRLKCSLFQQLSVCIPDLTHSDLILCPTLFKFGCSFEYKVD